MQITYKPLYTCVGYLLLTNDHRVKKKNAEEKKVKDKRILKTVLELLLPSHDPFNPETEEGKKLLAIWGLVLETLSEFTLFEGTFYYILKHVEEEEKFRMVISERLNRAGEIVKGKG